MESAHRVLGWLVGGAALLVAMTALAGWLRPPLRRHWLDRAIVAAMALIALDVLAGLMLLLLGAAPSDGLHFLYAALALAVLPAARFWRGRGSGARATSMTLAAVVLLGFTLRLFQTG